MFSSGAHVPDTEELAEFLLDLADELGLNYAPVYSAYDKHRPQGWASWRLLCHDRGLSKDTEGWEQLATMITGLPAYGESNRRKTYPTRKEVEELIKELSFDGYAPTVELFDDCRPTTWPRWESIGRNLGVKWTDIIRGLGLKRTNTVRELSPAIDIYPGPLPPGENEAARFWSEGIRCTSAYISILAWHWPTRAYRRVGEEEVLVLK